MAKQAGAYRFRGTLDGLCFYKMEGQYYVRRKSSLSSKRFWKDRAFEGSRRSCNRFSQANQLASKLYRMIDEERRNYKLYCFLKKRAIQLLKEEKSLEHTAVVLMDYLRVFGFMPVERAEAKAGLKDRYSMNPVKEGLKDRELPTHDSGKLEYYCHYG